MIVELTVKTKYYSTILNCGECITGVVPFPHDPLVYIRTRSIDRLYNKVKPYITKISIKTNQVY